MVQDYNQLILLDLLWSDPVKVENNSQVTIPHERRDN